LIELYGVNDEATSDKAKSLLNDSPTANE